MRRPSSPLAHVAVADMPEDLRQLHAASLEVVGEAERGFSAQSNAKVSEGKRYPDRDTQFRYIAAQAKEHLAAGQPVISVDAKKKEQVGPYAQAGRETHLNLECLRDDIDVPSVPSTP